MPVTSVRTAVPIFIATVLVLVIGLAAKVVAILLVIQYIIQVMIPDMMAPLRQRMGLGKREAGFWSFMAGLEMVSIILARWL